MADAEPKTVIIDAACPEVLRCRVAHAQPAHPPAEARAAGLRDEPLPGGYPARPCNRLMTMAS